jgi:cell division protein ZapA
MTKQIEAKILGRDFSVGCPENEEESLLKSINYLNHKIEEIQKTGNVIGVDKTIIMAALNITHEYLNQGNNSGIHIIGYKDKLSKLNQILDEALDSD